MMPRIPRVNIQGNLRQERTGTEDFSGEIQVARAGGQQAQQIAQGLGTLSDLAVDVQRSRDKEWYNDVSHKYKMGADKILEEEAFNAPEDGRGYKDKVAQRLNDLRTELFGDNPSVSRSTFERAKDVFNQMDSSRIKKAETFEIAASTSVAKKNIGRRLDQRGIEYGVFTNSADVVESLQMHENEMLQDPDLHYTTMNELKSDLQNREKAHVKGYITTLINTGDNTALTRAEQIMDGKDENSERLLQNLEPKEVNALEKAIKRAKKSRETSNRGLIELRSKQMRNMVANGLMDIQTYGEQADAQMVLNKSIMKPEKAAVENAKLQFGKRLGVDFQLAMGMSESQIDELVAARSSTMNSNEALISGHIRESYGTLKTQVKNMKKNAGYNTVLKLNPQRAVEAENIRLFMSGQMEGPLPAGYLANHYTAVLNDQRTFGFEKPQIGDPVRLNAWINNYNNKTLPTPTPEGQVTLPKTLVDKAQFLRDQQEELGVHFQRWITEAANSGNPNFPSSMAILGTFSSPTMVEKLVKYNDKDTAKNIRDTYRGMKTDELSSSEKDIKSELEIHMTEINNVIDRLPGGANQKFKKDMLDMMALNVMENLKSDGDLEDVAEATFNEFFTNNYIAANEDKGQIVFPKFSPDGFERDANKLGNFVAELDNPAFIKFLGVAPLKDDIDTVDKMSDPSLEKDRPSFLAMLGGPLVAGLDISGSEYAKMLQRPEVREAYLTDKTTGQIEAITDDNRMHFEFMATNSKNQKTKFDMFERDDKGQVVMTEFGTPKRVPFKLTPEEAIEKYNEFIQMQVERRESEIQELRTGAGLR